jgi:hypothetical protein
VVSDGVVAYIDVGGLLALYEDVPVVVGLRVEGSTDFRAVYTGDWGFRGCGPDVEVLWELCCSSVTIVAWVRLLGGHYIATVRPYFCMMTAAIYIPITSGVCARESMFVRGVSPIIYRADSYIYPTTYLLVGVAIS